MKYYKLPNYSDVTVVEIPRSEITKIDIAVCAQPKQTLSSYYNSLETKPAVVVNGGFFALVNGNTVFDLIDEHQIISDEPYDFYGIGMVGDSDITFARMSAREDWRDFISAYPPLIVDGDKWEIDQAKEINYNARRSIFAYDDNTVYVIAVEGKGMTFSKMQSMLKNMGVEYAINLDGGGSTKILYEGKSITSKAYNRAVDSVIAIYAKAADTTTKILYRVQVGAFSKYDNAINMQTTIQNLEDDIGAGYKNAYVKHVDNLYKVQVGAFSKRENAEKVIADLASKGFDGFITTK